MSTNSNPQRPDLPSAAVDRVFSRLNAIFGVQRMAAAWAGVPADERQAVWGRAIARAVWSPARGGCDLESIGAALDDLAAEPTTWPPSSGEFADRCERFAQRPGRNVRALPSPPRTEGELERGRAHLAAMRSLVGGMRAKAAGSRVPGSDDEPPPAPPAPAACTCWSGLTRAESACPACAAFARNRARQAMWRDGVLSEGA